MTNSRRQFLLRAGATALCAGAGSSARAAEPGSGGLERSDASLTDLSAAEAVAHLRHGDLTAERYAGALLRRCAASGHLNAFISLEPDRVLEAARGADRSRASNVAPGLLHGLPIPVKDSLNTRDYATTAGTPGLRHFRPREDAPLVAALRRAGGIVLGKTNLHELSYGWTSNNLAFGAVRNPYDPTRIPGGSSGGTAAAIAARMAPLGVAEDTQGSIRVPAAFCGLAGFRPTTGRYSTVGAVPISPLFDQAGPHARRVADIALFDAVASGDTRPLRPVSLKGVKLAVCRGFWFEGLDPEVARLTSAALDRLRDAGAILVEEDLPDVGALTDLTTYQVQNHDVRIELPRYLRRFGAGVSFDALVAQASSDIRELFAHDVLEGGPGFVTDEVYRTVVEVHLPALRETYRRFFARTGVAAIVFPTTRTTAPRIGDEGDLWVGGKQVPFDVAVARNISPGSTAGLPGLVLPTGLAAGGLPVSLEFDAPAGADRALLALGLTVEGRLDPMPAPQPANGPV